MQKNTKNIKTWLLSICLIATSALASSSLLATPVANPAVNTLPNIQRFTPLLNDIKQRFPKHNADTLIVISASEQKLFLIENNKVSKSYTISTAEAGLGSLSGSNKTPLGVHKVSQMYGKGATAGTIFKARQNTKRVAEILTQPDKRSKADNVTTRIMWLSGLEKGINKGGKVDSHARYIYIHGTDEEGRLGQPASHGCIRMANSEVIELFDKVSTGTLVIIIESISSLNAH